MLKNVLPPNMGTPVLGRPPPAGFFLRDTQASLAYHSKFESKGPQGASTIFWGVSDISKINRSYICTMYGGVQPIWKEVLGHGGIATR